MFPTASSTRIIIVGYRFGIVTFMIRWKMLAPSISAASYISVSIPEIAARYITVPYPRLFQADTITRIYGQ
ncbi:hypothetical protein D3C86_2171880 [compost metagenome]